MYGYVYKTTNLITNKIYIGQKKSKIFLQEKYLGSGKLLKKSIAKYGKENFKTELVCECNSKQELDDSEIYYIDLFDARNPQIGYNIASGGAFGDSGYHQGMLGKHQSEKQKSVVAKTSSYKRSDEMKENFSKARQKSWQNEDYRSQQSLSRKGRKAPNKGVPCSEEQKQKISNTVSQSLKTKWNNLSTAERQKIGDNISKGKRGKIAITDTHKTFYISPEQWEEYENKGYYKMSYQTYIKTFNIKTT